MLGSAGTARGMNMRSGADRGTGTGTGTINGGCINRANHCVFWGTDSATCTRMN
jgi:hypothetical protein